ncbi:MAG TPA: ImmA/IrrE family metallo-endopeptidase [Chloroflexota bacterium]|nr:ImmA/IrrE family metallo-endopeptidase [Chloroflexota bacterium]
MPEAWIGRAVEAFWDAAGGTAPFPRDMGRAVESGLPASIVPLPGLTLGTVGAWLVRAGLPTAGDEPERTLCGCLVAWRGQGTIFVDADGPPDEQRLTVAHEAAHLICDHLMPREAAVARLGAAALEVLDGQREPSDAERLDAALARVPLGVQVHLLERGGAATAAAEERADRLALELVAPFDEVARRLGDARREPAAQAARATALLVKEFGVPPAVAAAYGRRIGWATARASRLTALLHDRPASHLRPRTGRRG